MPHPETDFERDAHMRGEMAARSAASWVTDGNHPREHYVRLLRMMDDGDPALSDYLPQRPNLSGEWSDDTTDHTLALDILGPDYLGKDRDALAEAWERGVDETFESECERLVREALS